jgi:hypothetical protein
MKIIKSSGLTITLFLASFVAANAQLLLDRFVAENPAGAINWSNAGVKEDIRGAAIGSIGGSANEAEIYNLSNLSVVERGASNLSRPNNPSFGGLRFPENPLLNSYVWFTTETYHLELDGFVDERGTPRVLTTHGWAPFEDARNRFFMIRPNQTYRLYLFGVGYRDGQNTTFIFKGEEKTTNPAGHIMGSSEDAHYVVFEFTTPADLRGWKLEFSARRTNSFSDTTGANGAFNGLALVPM